MVAHRKSAEEAKKTEQDTLAKLLAHHQATVKELKDDLADVIEDLKQGRADQREDYEAQKLAREKLLQMEKETHANDLATLTSQINELTKSKAEVVDDLKQIKEQHLN